MATKPDSLLYYECHVTIEPVFDERLELAERIANLYQFIVADLLMQKRREDLPVRSKYDTFMTSRHKNYKHLEIRMYGLILNLRESGFKIWRFKIEDTILDSKLQPELRSYLTP